MARLFRPFTAKVFSFRHAPSRPGILSSPLNQVSPLKRRSRFLAKSTVLVSNETRKCHGSDSWATGLTSLSPAGFWRSRLLWKRAGINTFRCLIGCTLGDFSALWYQQANYPDLSVGLSMGVSSKYISKHCLCGKI